MAVKRMMIRFTEEDEGWISEQAADEGVDNATFVRMLVHRLRLGRPALLRTALETSVVVPVDMDLRPGAINSVSVRNPLLSRAPLPRRDDVLTEEEKAILAELDSGNVSAEPQDEPLTDLIEQPIQNQQANGTAMSLRKVLPVMHPSNPAYLGSR